MTRGVFAVKNKRASSALRPGGEEHLLTAAEKGCIMLSKPSRVWAAVDFLRISAFHHTGMNRIPVWIFLSFQEAIWIRHL